MLRRFRADLHVHTCLSPCGEEEMRPPAIVRRAKEMGLDAIAICDHNSTGNVEAVRAAGQAEGVAVIGGVEVCSREEVHVLGLFDEEESVRRMQRVIDENLSGENNPELFGDQVVCDERGATVRRENRLLIGATRMSVEVVVERIHRLGGLAIASHVDREGFSILGQLGFVPEGLPVDALEVSCLHSPAEAAERFPQIAGHPLVRSSDAHRLAEIGAAFTTLEGASPCVAELRQALRRENGRTVEVG